MIPFKLRKGGYPYVPNNIRLLNWINNHLDLSYFYTISVHSGYIIIQGHYNNKLIKDLQKLNIEMSLNPDSGYIQGNYKHLIEITLT